VLNGSIRPIAAARDAVGASNPAGEAKRVSNRRFDRLAIASVFGDPKDPKTWSAAPANLADALARQGVEIDYIHSGPKRSQRGLLALRYALSGYGKPPSFEAVLRTPGSRASAARRISEHTANRAGGSHVLHMGTLDLPAVPDDGTSHYLYCDDDWSLSFQHRPDARSYPARTIAAFDRIERQAVRSLAHVFTFSRHLRDHFIAAHGLPPDRVTAVGCGMGRIEAYDGDKDYASGRLLFVAKHLFREKGGVLLLRAFAEARRRLPVLALTIVGDPRSRAIVGNQPGVEVRDHLSWDDLQGLYRQSALLVQPMLNDPWGQVYVEALVSRTPVLGLNRNGLPEIVEGGRHGFLVDKPDEHALAEAIVEAVRDPVRLRRMGHSGQRHALATYTWDRVASRILHEPVFETVSETDRSRTERILE